MEELRTEMTETGELSPFVRYLKKIFAPDGWATKLTTPVGRVKIADARVSDGFTAYLDRVKVGTTFRAIDLLVDGRYAGSRSKEIRSICKNGGLLFLIEGTVADNRLRYMLNSFSVRGICTLMTVCGGIELQIPASVTPEDLVHSQFVVLREKDADAICKATAQLGNAKLIPIGKVLDADLLRVDEWGKTTDFLFSDLFPETPVSLQLGDDCTEFFFQGRDAALAAYCCSGIIPDRTVRFAESLPLPQFIAAIFGIYDVWTLHENGACLLRFASGTQVGFVVPKPFVMDGDQLYAFCPKGEDGIPDPDHTERLYDFLNEQHAGGNIKSVLPLKKNARSMLSRICGEELEYVPERDFPFGTFTVLAVVPSDKTLPGTKLGVFRSVL